VTFAQPDAAHAAVTLEPFDPTEVERGHLAYLRFIAAHKPTPGVGVASFLAHNPPETQ
jgi:hypothetical protein